MRRRAAVALVGALVVGGCHAHLPPVVPAAPAAAAAPPLDPSLLVVDASADLATLAGTLDVLLALAGNDTRIEGLRLRRRPIGVKAVGDEVVLDVPLALEAGGAGRCGDRTLVLGWSIRLMPEVEATPSGASLRLAAPRVEAQGDDLSCLEGRAATVGGLVVLGAKAIEAALPALLEHLRVPLDGAVDATGRALATPRALTIGGAPACLLLAPTTLVVGRPLLSGGDGTTRLRARLGVRLTPRLALGVCPAAPAPHPLGVEVADGALPSAFRVVVPVVAPWAALRAQLQPLVGRRLGDGDRALTVKAIDARPLGGRLLLAVEVAGALEGTLYLWGSPTLEGTALVVPELSLALESRSALSNLRFWATTTFERGPSSLREQALRALRLELSTTLDEARRALSAPLALGGRFELTPTLRAARPIGARATPEGVVLDVALEGSATLAEAP